MKKVNIQKDISKCARITPAAMLLYCTSATLCTVYVSAIVLALLPDGFCGNGRAMECAADLFHISFRIIALAAVFITLCAYLNRRYNDDGQ